MNLKRATVEYEMKILDCIEASSTIKNLALQDETYNRLAEEVFKLLIKKGYLQKSYFISFDEKIVEQESEDETPEQDSYVWIVQCRASVYQEINF